MDYDPRRVPPAGGTASPYGTPPGGYPSAGGPPAYPYGMPASFIPPADNQKPILVTAARPLTAAQYRRMLEQVRSKPLWLPWLLFGVCALFFVAAVMAFRLYPKNWQAAAFLVLNCLALCGAGVYVLVLKRRRAARINKLSTCLAASDTQTGKIELYGNRAVWYTTHGKTVLPFGEVDVLYETPDMVGISGAGQFIAWKAEDLSPEEARLLLTCLTYTIRPGCYRRIGALTPWLPSPLMPPEDRRPETVWLSVPVEKPAAVPFASFMARQLCRQAAALAPLWVLAAGLLAIYRFITPDLMLDMAIYLGLLALLALGLLVAVNGLLYAAGKTQPADALAPDEYRFLPDGLLIRSGENERFIDKRYIRPVAEKQGVRLCSPWGDFRILWSQTAEPERLKTILSL